MKNWILIVLVSALTAWTQNMVVTTSATKPWQNAYWPQGMNFYPIWSTFLVWAPWPDWLNPTTPVFDPLMREAGLVTATSSRDQDPVLLDVYPGERADGTMLPFDPNHPFFNALRIFRTAGIRPIVDIGSVPDPLCEHFAGESGPHRRIFRWSVNGANDYQNYYEFIRELFLFLQGPGMFTRAEVESWQFQLLREPDNPDSWDPHNTSTPSHNLNLEEYKILYDNTLAGMRAAGLNINLHAGNFLSQSTPWVGSIAAFLAGNEAPKTLNLSLPRIRTGTANDTMVFSFSAYATTNSALDISPAGLGQLVVGFRNAVRQFYTGPLRITVGEGGIFFNSENIGNGWNHRGDGSEKGAAWNAGIFKSGFDSRLSRYQQWGYQSATHISDWSEYDGVNSSLHGVIQMFRRFEGAKRMVATITRNTLANTGDKMDALVARNEDGRLFILVYNYNQTRTRPNLERVDIHIDNMVPLANYRILNHLIDRNQGSYMTRLHADIGVPTISPSPYDGLMEGWLTPAQQAIFDVNRRNYQNLSLVTTSVTNPYWTATANSSGRLTTRIDIATNSVHLLEIEPTTTVPAILAPTLLR